MTPPQAGVRAPSAGASLSATAGPKAAAAAPTGERPRVALEYVLDGDLRFLSHHDELRMLTRALVRARWPLAYSQGFNPAPRLVLPLPRSLGTASNCQLAVITLRAPADEPQLSTSLAAVLPSGCRIQWLARHSGPAVPRACGATYELELSAADAARVGPRIAGLMTASPCVVQRDEGPGKPSRPVDIRPFIRGIELEGRVLRLDLRIENQRSARPTEITTEFGLAAEECNHCIRRVAVQWDAEFTRPASGPVPPERNEIDPAENNGRNAQA